MHTLLAAFLAMFSSFSGQHTPRMDDHPHFAADTIQRIDLIPPHHELIVEVRGSGYPKSGCSSCQTMPATLKPR